MGIDLRALYILYSSAQEKLKGRQPPREPFTMGPFGDANMDQYTTQMLLFMQKKRLERGPPGVHRRRRWPRPTGRARWPPGARSHEAGWPSRRCSASSWALRANPPPNHDKPPQGVDLGLVQPNMPRSNFRWQPISGKQPREDQQLHLCALSPFNREKGDVKSNNYLGRCKFKLTGGGNDSGWGQRHGGGG